MTPLEDVTLLAWVGEDELGSGEIGLKQGFVPAGLIPLVAVSRDEHKMRALKEQLNAQAATCGKRIYLCRFHMYEIVDQTEAGQ